MDFDDGNWQYRGTILVNGKAVYSPWKFSKKTTAIEAVFKASRPNWYRAGYVVFESNGLQIPKTDPLSFGRSVLTSPDYPEGDSYRIKFSPVQWAGVGRLRFWEFIPTRRQTRLDPINPVEFTAQELELLQTSGLDPTKLRLSSESLEIVLPLLVSLRSSSDDSISTRLTTILEELRTMANTDIRSFKKMVSDLTAQVSEQALEIATTGAKVVSMETTMVIENTFSVLKAAFILVGDFWVYDLTHGMNSLTPDVSIYDTDPATGKAADLQLIQATALSLNSLRIELNAGEYADNNFPLEVVIQAKNSPVTTDGTWKRIPNGTHFWRLLNGNLDRSDDGINASISAFVSGVVRAVMSGNGDAIHYQGPNDAYFAISNGNLGAAAVPSNSGNHEASIAIVGSVIL